jgi:hypothetical protein
MQNVFNAVLTGGSGPWDDDEVLDDIQSWMGDIYDVLTSQVSDFVKGSQIIAYKYDSVDDDWDEVKTENWSWDPTGATEQLPRGAAALLNARTLDPDVNGKKYMGGFTENELDEGLWSSGAMTQLVLMGGEWTTPLTPGTSGALITPGIWSPTGGLLVPCSGTVIIPTMPAYQRRRKRGVGI